MRRLVERAAARCIRSAKRMFRILGYEIVKVGPAASTDAFPADFTREEIDDIIAVRPYTLTSSERMVSLTRAVAYVVDHSIPGDLVECGVWKGGSVMLMARALLRRAEHRRDIHLFDTFEGMTEPTSHDVSYNGEVASRTYVRVNERLIAIGLDEVKKNVLSVGYDPERIHFIKGKVEETIPRYAPGRIALLRLDTDWYESTKHELVHLFPRVSPGGVVIVDDYGHWSGARRAVDEYLRDNRISLLLARIDYTGRIGVKIG
jgi:hypothetical protein